MNNDKTGGPAFPSDPFTEHPTHGRIHRSAMGEETNEGMTLRDYFAAKAMHAEISTAGMHLGAAQALADAAEVEGQTIEERVAFNAYAMADAMLKARQA